MGIRTFVELTGIDPAGSVFVNPAEVQVVKGVTSGSPPGTNTVILFSGNVLAVSETIDQVMMTFALGGFVHHKKK